MERIEIADRTVVRVLALLPAVVVAVAVRLLTLSDPPLALRAAAAAAVALACWVAYRLLTARVVVAEGGVEVRGVLFEGHIPWSELDEVEIGPAVAPLRALVWGVMRPHGLLLRAGSKVLRPVAAVCREDDDELTRALGAMRVRLGAWGVPEQRQAQESVTSA